MDKLANALRNPGSLCAVLPLLQNLFLYEDFFDAFDLNTWQLHPEKLPCSNISMTALPILRAAPLSLIEAAWHLIRAAIGAYYTDQQCWQAHPHYMRGGFITEPPPPTTPDGSSDPAALFYEIAKGPIASYPNPSGQRRRFRKNSSSSSPSNHSGKDGGGGGGGSGVCSGSCDEFAKPFTNLPDAILNVVFAMTHMRASEEDVNRVVVAMAHMLKTFPSISPDLCAICIEAYSIILSYSAVHGVMKESVATAVQAHLKLPIHWIPKIEQLPLTVQGRVLCHILQALVVMDVRTSIAKFQPLTLLNKTKRAFTAGGVNAGGNVALGVGSKNSSVSSALSPVIQESTEGGSLLTSKASSSGSNTPTVLPSWEQFCLHICSKRDLMFRLHLVFARYVTNPINTILSVSKPGRRLTMSILDPDIAMKVIFTSNGGTTTFLKGATTVTANTIQRGSSTTIAPEYECADGAVTNPSDVKLASPVNAKPFHGLHGNNDSGMNDSFKKYRVALAVCALLRRAEKMSYPISFLFTICNFDVGILGQLVEHGLRKCQSPSIVARDLENLFVQRPQDTDAMRVLIRKANILFTYSSLLRNVRTSMFEGSPESAILLEKVSNKSLITVEAIASLCLEYLPEPQSAAQVFKSFPTTRPLLQTNFPAITTTDPAEAEELPETHVCSSHKCRCRARLPVTSRLRRPDPVKMLLNGRGRVGWSVIHGVLLEHEYCAELMSPSGSPEASGALLAEYARDLKSCRAWYTPSDKQIAWFLTKCDTWLTSNRVMIHRIWGWQSIWKLEQDESSVFEEQGSGQGDWSSAHQVNDPSNSISPNELAKQPAPAAPFDVIDFKWDSTVPDDATATKFDAERLNRVLRYTSLSIIRELITLFIGLPRNVRNTPHVSRAAARLSTVALSHFSGHASHGEQEYSLEPILDVPAIQLHETTCQQTNWLSHLYLLYLHLTHNPKCKKQTSYLPDDGAITLELIGCKLLLCHQLRRLCLTRYFALHPVRSSFNAAILNGPAGSFMSPDVRRSMLFARSDNLHETLLKVVEVLKFALSDDLKLVNRRVRKERLQAAYAQYWDELRDKGVIAQLLLMKGEPLICSRSRRIVARLRALLAPGKSPSISDALTATLLNIDRKTPFHHYGSSSSVSVGYREMTQYDLQQLYSAILYRRHVSSNLLLSSNLDLDRWISILAKQDAAESTATVANEQENSWSSIEGLIGLRCLDPGTPTLPLRYCMSYDFRHTGIQSVDATLISRSICLSSEQEVTTQFPQLLYRGVRVNAWYNVWYEVLHRGSTNSSLLTLLHRSLLSEYFIQRHAIVRKVQRGIRPGEQEVVQYLRLAQFGALMLAKCECINDILKSCEFIEFLVRMSGVAFRVELKDREKFIRNQVTRYCQRLNIPTHGVSEGGSADTVPAQNPELKQIVSIETMLRSKILSECQSKLPLPLMAAPSSTINLRSNLSPHPATATSLQIDSSSDFAPTTLPPPPSFVLNTVSGNTPGGSSDNQTRSTSSLVLSPLNGHRIVSVDTETTKVLKSAAKVPYTIRFEEQQQTESSVRPITHSLIFKCNDDIRQDMLVHQVSCLMNNIFVRAGLPLRLITYKAIPVILPADENVIYGGIIEMIENTKSRHDIGTIYGLTLDGYYSRSYSSQSLEQARWNFTTSLAASSLLTFIMQIKDRHNANILLTHDGFLIHIDFGFILDLAPAHDLKFERAPFKLTSEMIGLIDGGSQESSGSLILRQLITHGYLALREYKKDIVSLIQAYEHSNLKGYKNTSIQSLKTRLQYDKSDREATEYILRQTRAAVNALTTKLYDVFQSVQQGIAF